MSSAAPTVASQPVLLELNCRYGQGYLLGRPMPADQIEAMLGLTSEALLAPQP